MKAVLFVISIGLVLGSQLVPIPSQAEGLGYGNPQADYTIDVFYDHLCSDSSHDYPGLKAYLEENKDVLYVRIHMFTLTYSPNTFFITQAGKYIQLEYPDKFLAFLEYFFQNQETYLVYAKNWDLPTIKNAIAKDASLSTGIDQTEILEALATDKYNYATRNSWKYGLSRQISGTPQYLINGVGVADASQFSTKEDWEGFFNELKNSV